MVLVKYHRKGHVSIADATHTYPYGEIKTIDITHYRLDDRQEVNIVIDNEPDFKINFLDHLDKKIVISPYAIKSVNDENGTLISLNVYEDCLTHGSLSLRNIGMFEITHDTSEGKDEVSIAVDGENIFRFDNNYTGKCIITNNIQHKPH